MMKKTNLSERISLSAKQDLPIKKDINPENIESLTKKLHHPKEKTVRVTIDIPEQMYMQMKMKTIQEKVSVRRFFLNLLQANLNQTNNLQEIQSQSIFYQIHQSLFSFLNRDFLALLHLELKSHYNLYQEKRY